VIEFSLGTLDSGIEKKPDAHVFTDHCANWFEITDDLPQFKVPYRGSVNPTPLGGQGLELALYSEYGAL